MTSQELQLLALPIRYSSWTVRPVVLLEYFGIPYSAKFFRLADAESLASLHAESPSGLVPVIIDKQLPHPVHDSLAIGEYLHDKYPEKGLWPKELKLRTYGRSIVAELHSGFTNIRTDFPHNFAVKYNPPPQFSDKLLGEVKRVLSIFDTARNLARETLGDRDEGFLLGSFSIADAFYWPVLSRFLKRIGEMQLREVKEHPEYNVPFYDNYVPGSQMEFWDIEKIMG